MSTRPPLERWVERAFPRLPQQMTFRVGWTTDEPDDASNLLGMASRVKRLHVRYKIALAIARLHERGRLANREPEALNMLARFEVGADESLARRLAMVRQQIGG